MQFWYIGVIAFVCTLIGYVFGFYSGIHTERRRRENAEIKRLVRALSPQSWWLPKEAFMDKGEDWPEEIGEGK